LIIVRNESEMKIAFLVGFILFITAFGGCRNQESFIEPVKLENKSDVIREVFEIKKYPALLAVGKLKIIGGRQCSLVLVAEDVAVTAGHCILEASARFNFTNEVNPYFTSAIFETKDGERLKDISVKRVLKVEQKPDYAIVRLTKKISKDVIAPLKISNLTIDEMISRSKRLGCAGFNGDILGESGQIMTISRNIKIFAESSASDVIDTNCISYYGGSGGLFFEETEDNKYNFLGVIWGMTDEKYNEQGELVKDENISTSITPVSAFYNELTKIIGGK
jgi:Trypsin